MGAEAPDRSVGRRALTRRETVGADRVIIRGLEVQCVLGMEDRERKRPRPILIDLEFPVGPPAGPGDAPTPSTDYARVAEEVRGYVQRSACRLMEELAEGVAGLCLSRFTMEWVRVRLGKPGAVAGAETVVLEIERGRNSPEPR